MEEPAKESGSNDGPSDEDGAGLNSAAGEGELLAFSTEATMAMNALVGQTAEAPAGSAAPAPGMEFHQTAAELEFGSKINYATLKDRIETTAAALKVNTMVDVVLNEPSGDKEWTPESPVPFNKWKATLNVDEVTAQKVFSTMQEDMNSEPIWHAADKIGSQVAGKTQSLAVWALLSSLLGIVAYIWIRFQKVVFGLAAVVALVHDVLITLGAIAVSFWLAGALSFLQIEEFKISLPVVAAFLTIIGYSLNDTIVVFDRIREVRGKSPELTEAMINASINQTLGRTLLTSITTLLVVTILYAGGGQSIHGFSFALLVGVIVGTYSSIFVASPALLWLMDRFGADH